MLLTLDIGNTNIKVGVFKEDELVSSWRISTSKSRTSDEYGVTLINLLASSNLSAKDVSGIIFSSVNPRLNYTIVHMCEYYFSQVPMAVEPGIKNGLILKYKDPKEIGADRIVNSVAVHEIYKKTAIVIDFGTATTFNVVTKDGEFLGGVIAPGIKSSTDALVMNASKLPNIELLKPKKLIGKTTIENMQSGVIYGFIGLCQYIVNKIKQELHDKDVIVVATGGLCELVSGEEKIIDVKDRTLTLKGLKIIYGMNKQEKQGDAK